VEATYAKAARQGLSYWLNGIAFYLINWNNVLRQLDVKIWRKKVWRKKFLR
jgi:hypothetical protein